MLNSLVDVVFSRSGVVNDGHWLAKFHIETKTNGRLIQIIIDGSKQPAIRTCKANHYNYPIPVL